MVNSMSDEKKHQYMSEPELFSGDADSNVALSSESSSVDLVEPFIVDGSSMTGMTVAVGKQPRACTLRKRTNNQMMVDEEEKSPASSSMTGTTTVGKQPRASTLRKRTNHQMVDEEEKPPPAKKRQASSSSGETGGPVGAFDIKWHAQYDKLVAFKNEHGHTKVPRRYKKDHALGSWTAMQRLKYLNGELREDRKELLDQLGFAVGKRVGNYDEVWHRNYNALVAFYTEHGHYHVPWDQQRLSNWCAVQRYHFSKGKLQTSRKRLLEQIGFDLSTAPRTATKSDSAHEQEGDEKASPGTKPNNAKWREQYDNLVEFHRRNGHFRVPRNQSKLANWVAAQRFAFANDRIMDDRKQLLEEIGFDLVARTSRAAQAEGEKEIPVAKSYQAKWDERFRKLKEFGQKHGHFRVPVSDAVLSNWCAVQRYHYSKGKLLESRRLLLEEIGFDLRARITRSTSEEMWQEQYKKLVEFKRVHGHIRVKAKQDKSLAQWVANQRSRVSASQTQFHEHRKQLLDELGFEWNVESRKENKKLSQDDRWNEQYRSLLDFSRKHGHVNVPQRYDTNPQLGRWVVAQRSIRTQGRMREDRKKLLDMVGFVWNPSMDSPSSSCSSSSAEQDEIQPTDGLSLLTAVVVAAAAQEGLV